ncbi:tyrosine-type recombinase/integrase [Nonomuraea pusilla]|uniref:Site-specific recombinase XerD n=1 Tax=Nonomuraea pusilla TaxID=46177 RepID=A0A1H8DZE2_9ACTN|nr:tyrosine-type recombinase/integrase [Nonomuraea pusilla]SEN11907.1 Site-specific recombinase XerD [Nonomuraea pusilla]
MLTHDVVIWSIRNRKDRAKPYQLRWKVGTEPKSKTFLTKALADSFRADLLKAAKKGELFDTVTGLPASMTKTEKTTLSWYGFCRKYVRMRWKGAAAKTRESIVDSLTVATFGMLTEDAARLSKKEIRAAMQWALIPRQEDETTPPHLDYAVRLLEKGTINVRDLADPIVARQVCEELTLTRDGKRAAADTTARRRRGLNTALEYAIDLGELTENPLKRVKQKKVARDNSIDRRCVVNPAQARELLVSLSYVGSWHRGRGRRLVAFFATLYFAGLRPAEAIGLRETDCALPQEGWGMLTLEVTRPSSGKQWTDSGTVHDERGLKQREEREVRPVPIPPELVRILRAHLQEFGVAPDGRLFRNERGGILGASTYARAWEEARRLALTPQQVASPLAGRPYDLRHAALSTWLNAGVDATVVAQRAGNSVEVLLKRYAKCLDGRDSQINRRIEAALET